MTVGLDYSQGQPRGAAVKGAGYGFVAAYLDNGIPGRTNLTANTTADMHGAGVDIVVVWETTATRATGGRDAGVADAKAADAAASAANVAGHAIYFVVDFDIPDYSPTSTDPRAKLGPVAAYFDGVVSVLGLARTGGYGGYWAIKRLFDAGLITYGWQTLAWSGGQIDPRIHLLQRLGTVVVDGVECDVDEAKKSDFGQNGVTMTSPQDYAAAVWAYPLANPEYDKNADPATGPGKATFPAGDYTANGDIFAQKALAAVLALATQVQSLISQEEASFLAAIRAQSVPTVDSTAVAKALVDAGVAHDVAAAFLAVLNKAAAA